MFEQLAHAGNRRLSDFLVGLAGPNIGVSRAAIPVRSAASASIRRLHLEPVDCQLVPPAGNLGPQIRAA
jgi:hypothetical protein